MCGTNKIQQQQQQQYNDVYINKWNAEFSHTK